MVTEEGIILTSGTSITILGLSTVRLHYILKFKLSIFKIPYNTFNKHAWGFGVLGFWDTIVFVIKLDL